MAADPILDRASEIARDDGGATGVICCVARAWESHSAELRRYLQHRLSDPDTAADVLQDVFVKAMRQGQCFCTLGNPRAWLFHVARNALVDRLRVANRCEPLTDTLAEHTEAMAPVDALAECLAPTIAELSRKDADILRACDLEGRTQHAYAQSQSLSLAADKSRLLRARRRLRERLTTVYRVHFEPDGRVCGHSGREVQ